MPYLFLAAAAFIAELASLVLVGSYLGWMWAFGLLAAAVVLGIGLVSGRAPATVRDVIRSLRRGESPGRAIVDGALLAVAGILLITPGFVSDVVGIALLLPPVRAGIHARLKAWLGGRLKHGRRVAAFVGHTEGEGEPDVIDVSGRETREPRRGRPSLPS